MPLSRRNLLASTLSATGVLRVLECFPRRPQLLVLNYHRIGDAASSPFDPGVFSTSAEGFDEQIASLKAKYEFATVDEALNIIEGKVSIEKMKVLVTFDDGYRDNFQLAFPVLKKHQVEAVFFLTTAAIATGTVPWWDEIAYLAKRQAPASLRITYPHETQFDLSPDHFPNSLRDLLRVFKSVENQDPGRFLAELRTAVGFAGEELQADLMMSWDDARAMAAAGMHIGVHTHSHRILSKLNFDEQVHELRHCREIIEHEVGKPALLLSYPVGARDSFNADTVNAARTVGMRAGFSFYGGTNLRGHLTPFDVKRVAFDSYSSTARVRLSTSLMAITGAMWV